MINGICCSAPQQRQIIVSALAEIVLQVTTTVSSICRSMPTQQQKSQPLTHIVLQVVEAVVSVVACLDSDRQVSTSRSMLEPVLQALQQQLQQLPQQLPPQQSQQANGAKSSSASLEAVEMVSILMDRLSILFRCVGGLA